jgi:hypothetical protein
MLLVMLVFLVVLVQDSVPLVLLQKAMASSKSTLTHVSAAVLVQADAL